MLYLWNGKTNKRTKKMNTELYTEFTNSGTDLNFQDWLCENLISARKEKKKRKRIKQLTLKGDFVAIFETITLASNETGCNRRAISRAALGHAKTTGGFKWEFEGVNT